MTRNAVKVVPLAFQVCAKSSTGADAVSGMPLLAVSVVKVPAAAVSGELKVIVLEPPPKRACSVIPPGFPVNNEIPAPPG